MASTSTGIEWCDVTWNPVRGCSRVSPGCQNCYAERIAYRFSGKGKPYEGLARKVNGHAQWTGKIMQVEEALLEPYHWKKPARVFVNSMSDLFHENVGFDFIRRVWGVMGDNPHLTFQILTKRPERMAAVVPAFKYLSNVWLGVSVENQEEADKRIPLLIETPAAIRFLSCEPLLGPITLHQSIPCGYYCDEGQGAFGHHDHPFLTPGIASPIHWVIVGGESGPGARPMHPDWARSLRDQCQAAKVAFFFKQWGEYVPGEFDEKTGYWEFQQGSAFHEQAHGKPEEWTFQGPPHGQFKMWPVVRPWSNVACLKLGKKWSGRTLDAKKWNGVPEREAVLA